MGVAALTGQQFTPICMILVVAVSLYNFNSSVSTKYVICGFCFLLHDVLRPCGVSKIRILRL